MDHLQRASPTTLRKWGNKQVILDQYKSGGRRRTNLTAVRMPSKTKYNICIS